MIKIEEHNKLILRTIKSILKITKLTYKDELIFKGDLCLYSPNDINQAIAFLEGYRTYEELKNLIK